jgi:hypothetical protein
MNHWTYHQSTGGGVSSTVTTVQFQTKQACDAAAGKLNFDQQLGTKPAAAYRIAAQCHEVK